MFEPKSTAALARDPVQTPFQRRARKRFFAGGDNGATGIKQRPRRVVTVFVIVSKMIADDQLLSRIALLVWARSLFPPVRIFSRTSLGSCTFAISLPR